MNAVLDVSSAIDSQDCVFPGCDREAERDGRCRWHIGRTPAPTAGAVVPGSLAHLMRDDEPTPAQEPVKETPVNEPVVLCRVEGCTRASVAQKGPWKGWCDTHKNDEMKRRAQLRLETQGRKASTPPAPDVPASAGIPPAPEAPPGGLTALAIAVDQAQADLDAALARREHALEALRAALEQEAA